MADTRVSKIKVRQGNFADLPMLDAGELGYATDNQRLFVGNPQIAVGTGNGVADTFVVPAPFKLMHLTILLLVIHLHLRLRQQQQPLLLPSLMVKLV
jgi:hypothetical protein